MSHLYVSDLDGTLLQDDATLSPYARERLTTWLQDGLAFTIATARSIVSVQEILQDLPLSLPVICANGAYISDVSSGRHRRVMGLAKPMDQELIAFIEARGLTPFASTYDGVKDGLFLTHIANEAMAWYYEERQAAQDERLHQVAALVPAIQNRSVICLNVMAYHKPLLELEQALIGHFGHRIRVYFYENWYSPEWYWLSIYDEQASKGSAIETLLTEQGLTPAQLTVFGDQLNDLSMFAIAGTAIAMENAHPDLKASADREIGTNSQDSVIEYLNGTVVGGNGN